MLPTGAGNAVLLATRDTRSFVTSCTDKLVRTTPFATAKNTLHECVVEHKLHIVVVAYVLLAALVGTSFQH